MFTKLKTSGVQEMCFLRRTLVCKNLDSLSKAGEDKYLGIQGLTLKLIP